MVVLLGGVGFLIKHYFFSEKHTKETTESSARDLGKKVLEGATAALEAAKDDIRRGETYIGRTKQNAPPMSLVTRMNSFQFVETKPLPAEIAAHIQALTPFQRLQPLDIYVGHEIRWRGWFASISRSGDFGYPATMVSFNASPGRGGMTILCYFNIEDVPRFKLLHAGTVVGISGTIDSVFPDLRIITVKNTHFFFFD
jgi:hypothetical protein